MVKYVKICPKCKSIDISIRWQSMWYFGFPASFKCNKCGYIGTIFPEIDIQKCKKKTKK